MQVLTQRFAAAGKDGTTWARKGAAPAADNSKLGGGKEIVLKFDSAIASKGTFCKHRRRLPLRLLNPERSCCADTDSNGREMVKRQRNARGPSYPPYQIGEPVAGNY